MCILVKVVCVYVHTYVQYDVCTYTLVNSCLCSVFVCTHCECILIALAVCDNVCVCVCISCGYLCELYVHVFVCINIVCGYTSVNLCFSLCVYLSTCVFLCNFSMCLLVLVLNM